MDRRISPTVRRRRLAAELRRLRDEAGIKAAQVATELDCSPGKISLMETGRVAISVPDAKAMLEFYGVNGRRRDDLVELARTARQRGWWQPYSGGMHPWLAQFVGLETEASAVRGYAADLVPDLLRTEEYQRSLRSTEDTDELVALCARRQEILAGEDPPTLGFVLDEAVLRRRVGSPAIMRDQLSRLLEAGRRDTVTVQVLPFAAGACAATSGSFVLLEFPEPADADLVYVEYLTGAVFLEGDEEVRPYRLTFDDLTAGALSPTRSAMLIKEAMKEL